MHNNKKKIGIKHIYYTTLLLVVLDSMHAWVFWPYNRFLVTSFFAIITIFIALIDPKMFSYNKKHIVGLIIVFLLARFFATRGNVNAYVGVIINSVNIILFIILAKSYKKEAIIYISKAMGVIIGGSVFFWLIFLLGLPLPNSPITFGYSEFRNEAQYFFNNYYLFLEFAGNIHFDITNLLFPRFHSIFLEPGYLGLLMVVFLFINKFNFRKIENIVFLLSLLLSLSLSAWLLGLFSFTIIALKKSSNKKKIIISIITGLLIFNSFFSVYNNGDNIINIYILERLKYDDSKGTISGYNRTDSDFEDWFNKNYKLSNNILVGSDDYNKYFRQSLNVGWKPYIAQYGLVGLGLYLLFLFYWYYKNRTFLTFGFMLLYVAIFMRGHHEIFWAVYPILYIGGIVILNSECNDTKNLHQQN